MIEGPGGEPTMIALAAIEALKIEMPHGEAPRIELSGIPGYAPLYGAATRSP